MANSKKRRMLPRSGLRRFVARVQRVLPKGIRTVIGIVLILLGVLGFLPVLGFWMIPAGLALIALDIPPLRRWLDVRNDT